AARRQLSRIRRLSTTLPGIPTLRQFHSSRSSTSTTRNLGFRVAAVRLIGILCAARSKSIEFVTKSVQPPMAVRLLATGDHQGRDIKPYGICAGRCLDLLCFGRERSTDLVQYLKSLSERTARALVR